MDLYNLSLRPTIIHPSTEVVFPTFEEDSPIFTLHVLFRYFDLFSFLLVWVSTVLLLHGYMRKWQAEILDLAMSSISILPKYLVRIPRSFHTNF